MPKIGMPVKIKNHAQTGIIVEKSESSRQYVIATLTLDAKRNRFQITPLPPSPITTVAHQKVQQV